MSLTIDQLRVIHAAIVEGGLVPGANLLLHGLGEDVRIDREDQALTILRRFCQGLLDNENYEAAATLQWGQTLLDLRPSFPRRIFEFLPKHNKMLLQGAVSTSKSYSAVAYFLLDYLRDPEYTAIKMIAVNESHLKANMFAHMLGLYRGCSIPMLDEEDVIVREADNYLGLKSAGNDFGIDGVATRQSKFGSGTIRGYKPKPYRKTPHPIWGSMTRLRILLDEGQHIPAGVFIDLNSPMGSMTENGLVKVAVCYNPVDISIAVVQLAEPDQGWTDPDLDTLHEWVSKHGWNVLRLDGAQCENVVARKLIYPGFQSYEAYMGYMKGGDNSASYYVEARGFPPIKGAVNTVIPGSWVNGCWGEATFVGSVEFLVTVDLAYAGQDNPVMGVFRWGEASGWRKRDGSYVVFKDRLNPAKDKPRLVLQLDQLMTLTKAADTITIAEEIMSRCKELGVKPDRVAVDSTGMGAGTYSHLARYFGDVLGIRWGEKSTGMKILAEDKEGSDKICDNNVTEMWWTLRRWMDPTVGAIIINPGVQQNPLTTELTYRRYWNLSRGRIRVESKEEYKARQKLSPDSADVCVMAPMLVRVRLGEYPGITDQLNRNSPYLDQLVSHESAEENNPVLERGEGVYASRLES